MIERAIPFLYLAAAVSFVLALKWLSAVLDGAARGHRRHRGDGAGGRRNLAASGDRQLPMDRRGLRGGHRDRRPDGADADDGRAAADRALPRLRSARGRAGGDGGVLPSGSPDRPCHHGGPGPRGAAGIPHLHRLPDGVRQAPGDPSHPADHLAVPEHRQPVAPRPRGGFRSLPGGRVRSRRGCFPPSWAFRCSSASSSSSPSGEPTCRRSSPS